jgi:nickel superoxide dismutase
MKRFALTALALAVTLTVAASARAHCQIPCGIYDDELRVQLIEEHITTIEKSMNQIISLSAAEKVNYNQLVRWIDNKERHAQEIQDIVTAYFMAQRIKSPISHDNETEVNEYLHKLALLHAIQVHAMKAKQSTDLEEVATLRDLVAKFRTAYFGEEGGHSH